MKKITMTWMILLAATLVMTGCSGGNKVAAFDPKDNQTEYSMETYGNTVDWAADSSTDCQDCCDSEDDEAFDDLTLADYLGSDYDKLSQDVIEEAENLFNQINESDDDTYFDLMESFNDLMRSQGIPMPYYTMSAFVEDHAEAFGEHYQEVLENEETLDEIYMAAGETGDYDAIDESLVDQLTEVSEALFEAAGFDYDEVVGQIENQTIQLALFQGDHGSLTLDQASIFKSHDISTEAMAHYVKVFNHVAKIIPEDYMGMITRFEINTDGTDNVMAHVIEETEDMSQWRLAIDIRDALDHGDFKDDLTETVVHELAHIITLNKTQMTDEALDTYATMEGQLKKKAYLNLFYEAYWKDIQGIYDDMLDEDMEEGAYAFYDQYSDQFVSDYAATNPEEDIAESFRVFVLEEKPQANETRDQKVNFFYQFEDLVKTRTHIRNQLGLNP